MMTQVTNLRVDAMRIARSIGCRTWPGIPAVATSEGEVLEQGLQIPFLLIAGPDRGAGLPTMATTGTWSILASQRPFRRWIAPGPEVA